MVTANRRKVGGQPPRHVEAGNRNAERGTDWHLSINRQRAQDRMLEYFEREQLPGDVKSTLAAALAGDLDLQSKLFHAMIDSWPKLQKGIEEIARKVSVAPWKVHPFARRGDKPDAKAEKVAKDMEAIVWGMKPRAAVLEKGLEDTIKALVRGFYYGHAVLEIRWEKGKDAAWQPRCTKVIPARYYGYPWDIETGPEGEDRLMFDPDGGMGARKFVDFPEHRFLVAINSGHAGHPSLAAPLRALTGYWLAAVYGLKWFLNFTQLYGIPWRHAEVGDASSENAVTQALANIGSQGFIVTKPGTKINILADASTAGQSLPQRELIALADQQCDQFILGQTLTGGVDKNGGSRALGEVHEEVRQDVVDGVADFVGGILTHQLIPAVATLNWGDSLPGLPEMWVRREEPKDRKAAAETLEAAKRIGMKVGRDFGYEEMGIPVPAEGEELLFEPGTPVDEEDENPETRGQKPEEEKKSVKAADASNEADPQKLFDQLEETLRSGSVVDWKAISMMLAVGFAEGAGEPSKEAEDGR